MHEAELSHLLLKINFLEGKNIQLLEEVEFLKSESQELEHELLNSNDLLLYKEEIIRTVKSKLEAVDKGIKNATYMRVCQKLKEYKRNYFKLHAVTMFYKNQAAQKDKEIATATRNCFDLAAKLRDRYIILLWLLFFILFSMLVIDEEYPWIRHSKNIKIKFFFKILDFDLFLLDACCPMEFLFTNSTE